MEPEVTGEATVPLKPLTRSKTKQIQKEREQEKQPELPPASQSRERQEELSPEEGQEEKEDGKSPLSPRPEEKEYRINLEEESMQELFLEHQSTDPRCLTIRERLAKYRQDCKCETKMTLEENKDQERKHEPECYLGKFKVDEDTGLVMHIAPPTVARTWTIVVPGTLKEAVLRYYHGPPISGHNGATRVKLAIKRLFWWKKMAKDIEKWVKACLVCALRKTRRRFGQTSPGILTTSLPWDICAIDVVGPLTESARKHRYVLTMIDCFSKYPIAIPLVTVDAEEVARAVFEHMIAHHSCPRFLLSDNATNLCGDVMTGLCKLFNIKQIRTVAYTPSLNPFVERYHSHLMAQVTALTNQMKDDWDLWLPVVLYAYRISTHATNGYSPMHVLSGRQPRNDIELAFPETKKQLNTPDYMHQLQDNLRGIFSDIRQRQRKVAEYNQNRRMTGYKPRDFTVGDYVLVYAPARAELLPKHIPRVQKMLDRFIGPFRIITVIGQGPSRKYVVHNAKKAREEVYRGETLSLYCPWKDDGTPSIQAREYMSKPQRMNLNAQVGRKFLPKDIQYGDLVAFPNVMPDGTRGFGIGKVVHHLTEKSFNCHWYSNSEENLLGTYAPCWIRPDGSWYAALTRQHARHEPLLTAGTYTHPITQDIIADCGFSLTAGNKIPKTTLDRIQNHRLFHWKCDADKTE